MCYSWRNGSRENRNRTFICTVKSLLARYYCCEARNGFLFSSGYLPSSIPFGRCSASSPCERAPNWLLLEPPTSELSRCWAPLGAPCPRSGLRLVQRKPVRTRWCGQAGGQWCGEEGMATPCSSAPLLALGSTCSPPHTQTLHCILESLPSTPAPSFCPPAIWIEPGYQGTGREGLGLKYSCS